MVAVPASLRMIGAVSMQTGMRERKKAETRAAISKAARQLALARGADNVTAEAIAAAADVAPRTFHNYFANKEEAIVADLVDGAARLANALRVRPAGEPVWDGLQHAIVASLSGPPEELAQLTATMHMIKSSRSLRAHQLTVYEQTNQLLAGAIAERTGTDVVRDIYPHLLAAVAVMAMRAALRMWIEVGSSVSPADVAVDALAQLRAGLPEPRVGP
jgi:AcrR family transcriptional regulator